MSSSTCPRASPPCSTMESTMEWVMRRRGRRVSGAAAIRRSKVPSFQVTKPSGGFFFLSLRSFLGSSPALATSLAFSISYSGASAITMPSVSKPARPARPAIWWRVGAADDGQEALLGEALDEQAVARQHAGVVHADAAGEQALQDLAERRGEAGPARRLLDPLALLLAGDAEVGERLRRRQGGVLREVDDVERGLAAPQGELDGALERGGDVVVGQGHRARGVGDYVDGRAGAGGERVGDLGHVAERRAHQHELGVWEREQRSGSAK